MTIVLSLIAAGVKTAIIATLCNTLIYFLALFTGCVAIYFINKSLNKLIGLK